MHLTLVAFPHPLIATCSIKLYHTWGRAYPIWTLYDKKKEGFPRMAVSDTRAMGRFVDVIFYDFSAGRSYRMGK